MKRMYPRHLMRLSLPLGPAPHIPSTANTVACGQQPAALQLERNVLQVAMIHFGDHLSDRASPLVHVRPADHNLFLQHGNSFPRNQLMPADQQTRADAWHEAAILQRAQQGLSSDMPYESATKRFRAS
jgi:hypothetical protein